MFGIKPGQIWTTASHIAALRKQIDRLTTRIEEMEKENRMIMNFFSHVREGVTVETKSAGTGGQNFPVGIRGIALWLNDTNLWTVAFPQLKKQGYFHSKDLKPILD